MHIVYFSPTGGTRKAAKIIANAIAPTTAEIDITDHKQQEEPIELTPDDSILVAVPVYGGRVPAVAINRLKRITGHNTPAIPVVVYGNRDYDDALLELKSALEANGFKTVACIACIAEHSIMRVYAHGRPDTADTARLQEFGRQIKAKLSKLKPGEIVPVEIEIWPMGLYFDEGEILQLTVGAYQPANAAIPFGSASISVPRDGFTYMPGQPVEMMTVGGNATQCADPAEVVVSPATHNAGRHRIYTGGEYDSYLYVPVIPDNTMK